MQVNETKTRYSKWQYYSTKGIKHAIEIYGIDFKYGRPIWDEISTPTFMVGEFYKCLSQRQRIPSQSEFWNHLVSNPGWQDFWDCYADEPDMKFGLENRVYGRIYPACITQIYSQALLIETGFFREVYYDILEETKSIDITAVTFTPGYKLTIDIAIQGKEANRYRDIKENRRGHKNQAEFTVRTKRHANTFTWPTEEDFAEIITIGEQAYNKRLNKSVALSGKSLTLHVAR